MEREDADTAMTASAGAHDFERKSAPDRRTKLSFFCTLFGITLVLAGLFGCAMYAYQMKQQNSVLSQPAVSARIVAATRERNDGTRFTDALLDYARPTPDGPVDCKSAPARFMGWSPAFDVGNMVEVHPQPGSCYRPIHAPDIGNPGKTLIGSLLSLLIGAAMFAMGYRLRPQRKTGFG